MDFDVIWRFEFRKRTLFNDGFPDLFQHKGWILFLLGHCSVERTFRLRDGRGGESVSQPNAVSLNTLDQPQLRVAVVRGSSETPQIGVQNFEGFKSGTNLNDELVRRRICGFK